MGIEANTVVWLGIQSTPLYRLPDSLGTQLVRDGKVKVEGLTFREFWHADEPVGFGVELLDHDWRKGTVDFNPSELVQRVQDMMPKVVKAFQTMNIKAEPKVWLGTHL